MTSLRTSYNVAPNHGENGSNNGVPVGSVVAWTIANAPDGWLACNGAAISRSIYADLFSVIGTTYGIGDGSTTFNIPNTAGRTIRGVGGSFTPVSFSGGNDLLTITANNLPSHTHPITDPGHSHTVSTMSEGDNGTVGLAFGRLGNNQTNTTSTEFTGITQTDNNSTTGDQINIVNSFLTLNFIIKY